MTGQKGNLEKQILELPKNVKWCKKCVVSNQRPRVVFDDEGVCSGCLSAYYKNPEGIAHKVLADRMAERNPGNKPKPNDRIPYMFRTVNESPIHNGYYKNGKEKLKKRNILQGNRIEHPDFIEQNNIQIDYQYYISNQIMNPVKEILDIEKDENETEEFFQKFLQ